MAANVPPGLLDVARRWAGNLSAEGLVSVDLAVDPEGKEVRLLVVAEEFDELDGEPLPFRFRPIPGTGYPCVSFAMGPREREALDRGDLRWPTGWGSPPTLVPIPVEGRPTAKAIDRIREALVALGFWGGGVFLREEDRGRVGGRVVSELFRGHGMAARQGYLSFGLSCYLSAEDLAAILSIETLTMDEFESQGLGVTPGDP